MRGGCPQRTARCENKKRCSASTESPGTRRRWNGQPWLTVRRVVEAVAQYPDRDDLYRNYPELEPDDIRQAPGFAAANLEDSAADTDAA